MSVEDSLFYRDANPLAALGALVSEPDGTDLLGLLAGSVGGSVGLEGQIVGLLLPTLGRLLWR